jgi:hypothetical protein
VTFFNPFNGHAELSAWTGQKYVNIKNMSANFKRILRDFLYQQFYLEADPDTAILAEISGSAPYLI